jgi:gamma-glutamylcyclotransferase (GGCT)/AIG2-like uncharacterized protein YtfP
LLRLGAPGFRIAFLQRPAENATVALSPLLPQAMQPGARSLEPEAVRVLSAPTRTRSLVFFYGTLMAGFDRRRNAGIDGMLTFIGRGSIGAVLFDLGPYPAAIPAPDAQVWGELYQIADPDAVVAALDDIEGYRPDLPDQSLYTRQQTDVRLQDGTTSSAWVYFYNQPLGRATRIESGDYLEFIRAQ